LKKALQNEIKKTDCPDFEYIKGMTFPDRAERLIRAVLKVEDKKE